MRIAVVDNYDSFTYNLTQLLASIGYLDVVVMKNDNINWNTLEEAGCIVLSPGPGLPSESGDLMNVINRFYGEKPLLGVCLGFQALVEQEGGVIENMNRVVHGQQSEIDVNTDSIFFTGLKPKQLVARYHSWAVRYNSLPSALVCTASYGDWVMAFEHSEFMSFGVQFHPESVMTEEGATMIRNILKYIDGSSS